MEIKLCDICKRQLEAIHAFFADNKDVKSHILFDGKYMNGDTCMKYEWQKSYQGKFFCIQRLIKTLAADEEKEK